MRFAELVAVSNRVAEVSGRREKASRLADLLKRASVEEVPVVVAFLSGSLVQGRVGLGWAAIAHARSAPPSDVASLDLLQVNERFELMARASGAGASKQRSQLLAELFCHATAAEQDFLTRLISGDLRQGALEGVLIEALAVASGARAEAVRNASMLCGNLTDVAVTALTAGPDALSSYAIRLFRPVEPMLASPCEHVSEALENFGKAAFELKLDGARIQVHKQGEDVRVFSRALRDVTPAVPEVVDAVRPLAVREVILDGEVIALGPAGTPLPFQETMRRFGRKLDVDQLKAELPVTPFFFDCLYLDGTALTSEPQQARFAALNLIVPHFTVPHELIEDEDSAAAFFRRAVASGHEGVMAKALDAPYVAGTRGSSWLKIKQVRSLDLVVLAAEWGSGRRRGWLSNLHLGARDPERNGFVMLGKTFKGLTDEILEWQTAALLRIETERQGHIVFVRPELVVEVAFNDVQESPQYPGGLALRFARVKGYRPDKTTAQADTLRTLQEIYQAQTGRTAPPVRI